MNTFMVKWRSHYLWGIVFLLNICHMKIVTDKKSNLPLVQQCICMWIICDWFEQWNKSLTWKYFHVYQIQLSSVSSVICVRCLFQHSGLFFFVFSHFHIWFLLWIIVYEFICSFTIVIACHISLFKCGRDIFPVSYISEYCYYEQTVKCCFIF